MSYIFISVLVSSCAFQRGYFPPPLIPSSPTSRDWPDAGAVVLQQSANITYKFVTPKGSKSPKLVAELEVIKRIKLLSKAGLRWAKFSFQVDEFSSLTAVHARSVSPQGTIVNMPHHAVKTIPLRQGKMRVPGLRTVRFKVPKATVGGIIDLHYVRVFASPYLTPPWVMGNTIPTLRSEFSWHHTPGISVDFIYANGELMKDERPFIRSQEGVTKSLFVLKDLGPFFPEPKMVPATRIMPWVATMPRTAKETHRTKRFSDWSHLSQWIRSKFRDVSVGANTALKDLSKTPMERFKTLRQSLHPINGMEGIGVRRPVPMQKLLQGSPACSRDAAAAYTAVMRGSGYEVYPALISGPMAAPLSKSFVSPYPFSRVVVALKTSEVMQQTALCTHRQGAQSSRPYLCDAHPNEYIFVDTACKECRFGELPIDYSHGTVLVLEPDNPRWVELSPLKPEQNQSNSQLKLKLDISGQLKGAASFVLHGNPAQILRRKLYPANADKNKIKHLLQTTLLSDSPSGILSSTSIEGLDKAERSLVVAGLIESKIEKIDHQRFLMRPANLVGHSFTGRWRNNRRYTRIVSTPRWYETRVDIRLPPGFEATLPEVTKIANKYGAFASGYSMQGSKLRYTRRLVLTQNEITEEEWPEFYDFVMAIKDVEESGILIQARQ